MREQIIDFLRRELVGPDSIPPLVQENGEEILENDSPTVRYGAGVLFPKQTQIQESEREDSGETEVIVEEAIVDDKAQAEPEKPSARLSMFPETKRPKKQSGLPILSNPPRWASVFWLKFPTMV